MTRQCHHGQKFIGDCGICEREQEAVRVGFAGQALSGQFASQDEHYSIDTGNFEQVATKCFAMADAMMKARDL